EALDAMLDQLEGDAFGIVVPVGHLPVDAAAELCAEADDLLEKGRAEDAAARLFRALELLEDAREVREAVRVVDRLLALRPDDVVLHHQRAEFALGLNDRSLLVESYMALASSLRRQEAPDSARTVYARILEIDPEHAGASEALQSLAERSFGPPRDVVDLGGPAGPEVTGEVTVETPEAPTDFDALLGDLREPGIEGAVLEGDAQAHFELGIAFKQMEMWDEAIAELEQAVAGREDPRPVWEAMAECFTRLGDADRALEILLEAESHPANLSGMSPAIGYRIALLLEERGDRPGAIERLQRVVEAEPGFLDAAGRLSALSG
ncbi:MAG: tetratricopeptide repeat protein, partial [marine benthic group bacterium]|nr:tetratricopeptide repeat protein [Gemmatimonadota bacterium]